MSKLTPTQLACFALSCLLLVDLSSSNLLDDLTFWKKCPFRKLDKYLNETTETWDFDDNVLQLVKLRNQPDKYGEISDGKEEVSKLIDLLDEIRLDGIKCTQASMSKLLQASEKVVLQDKKELRDNRPLGHVVLTRIRKVVNKCLPQFNDTWNKNKIDEQLAELDRDNFAIFDLYNAKHAKYWYLIYESEPGLKCFEGALHRERPSEIGTITGDELFMTLHRIHNDLGHHSGELKHGQEKKGHKWTEEKARGLIEEYLLEPCRPLNERPEVESIFKPMIELGELMLTENYSHSPQGTSEMFRWTARYMECSWLLSLNKDKMAKLVSKCDLKRA